MATGVLIVIALMLQGMPAAAVDEIPAPVVWTDPSDTWVTTSWVSASWAIDGEDDVAGWALTVDQEPASDPGQEITQLDPYWSDWLPDGVHWLHVRAVAPDGTVGAVAHTRLALDTLAPEIVGLTSGSHPAGEASTTSTVHLSWPVPEDTSGVVGYQTVLSSADSPLEAEAEITTATPEATVDVPGDGVWSINVRAVDAAGLWGPFSTYEALVDAAAPQAPTVVGGFTTDDAQPGGFWHRRLATPHIEPAEGVTFDETHRQQSGTVRLGPGGAAYIEFTGPTDLTGRLTVTVGEGAAATLIDGVDGFPTICPRYTGPTLMAASSAPAAGHTSSLGSEDGSGCGNAVLVITNTARSTPWSVATTVSWTARFVPDMVMLESDWLTLGVSNTGVVGYRSGVQREGTYAVSLNDGWAVRDDEVAGPSFDYQDETVEPGVFTFNPERSTAYTGTSVGVSLFDGAALVVRQSVHPSQDPILYAVDVTVERPEPLLGQTPSAGGHVLYRRSTSWDVTWSRWVWQMGSTWAKGPGGDDSRVVDVTDDATWSGQSVAPWGTAGYATSGPHWSAGSTLDLDLGVIAPGDSVPFTLYYGVAMTQADAEAAVAAVEADVFYLAYPSWPAPDQSATGIFAYRATTPTGGAVP